MWTCPKCLTENPERSTFCENCAAPRSGGRFGAPETHQEANFSQDAGCRRRSSTPSRSYQSRPRQADPLPPRRSKACKLLRLCGFMLLVLLPFLASLIAWQQFDALYQALVPLITKSTEKTVMGYAVFAFYSLCALVVSVVPGLFLLTFTCKYKPNKHTEDLSFL